MRVPANLDRSGRLRVATNWQDKTLEFQSLPSFSWKAQDLIWELWEQLAETKGFLLLGKLKRPLDEIWLHFNVNGRLKGPLKEALLYRWVEVNAELAKRLPKKIRPLLRPHPDEDYWLWEVREPSSSNLAGAGGDFHKDRSEVTGMWMVSDSPRYRKILRAYRSKLLEALDEAVWAFMEKEKDPEAERQWKRIQAQLDLPIGPPEVDWSLIRKVQELQLARLLESLQRYFDTSAGLHRGIRELLIVTDDPAAARFLGGVSDRGLFLDRDPAQVGTVFKQVLSSEEIQQRVLGDLRDLPLPYDAVLLGPLEDEAMGQRLIRAINPVGRTDPVPIGVVSVQGVSGAEGAAFKELEENHQIRGHIVVRLEDQGDPKLFGLLDQLARMASSRSTGLEESVMALARLAGVPKGDVSEKAHEVRATSEML